MRFISCQGDGGGTIVYTFQASDKDIGSNEKLTYAIMSGHNGEFILNSNTGTLEISPTGLDRELHSSYNLTINVTDGGIPTLWVGSINRHFPLLEVNSQKCASLRRARNGRVSVMVAPENWAVRDKYVIDKRFRHTRKARVGCVGNFLFKADGCMPNSRMSFGILLPDSHLL